MAMLSTLEIYSLARGAGFSRDEAVIATAIAFAESGGNPRAHNDDETTGDDSFGLWQINMLGKLGPDRRQRLGLSRNEELFDPPTNARAARLVFLDQQRSFTPWTTFKKQKHEVHLGPARQAAQQFEAPGFALGLGVEQDVTEAELRKVVNEETTRVLNREARKIAGIESWDKYLAALLKAAREG
jgi:hypothetical protein